MREARAGLVANRDWEDHTCRFVSTVDQRQAEQMWLLGHVLTRLVSCPLNRDPATEAVRPMPGGLAIVTDPIPQRVLPPLHQVSPETESVRTIGTPTMLPQFRQESAYVFMVIEESCVIVTRGRGRWRMDTIAR
jgi:hypothetical protein